MGSSQQKSKPISGLTMKGYPPLSVQQEYWDDLQKIDWKAVEADMKDILTDSKEWWPADYGTYAGLFIRLSWHSCGLMEEAVVMAVDKGRLLFECLLRLTFCCMNLSCTELNRSFHALQSQTDSTQRGLGLTILILIRPDVSWNHSSENMETV